MRIPAFVKQIVLVSFCIVSLPALSLPIEQNRFADLPFNSAVDLSNKFFETFGDAFQTSVATNLSFVNDAALDQRLLLLKPYQEPTQLGRDLLNKHFFIYNDWFHFHGMMYLNTLDPRHLLLGLKMAEDVTNYTDDSRADNDPSFQISANQNSNYFYDTGTKETYLNQLKPHRGWRHILGQCSPNDGKRTQMVVEALTDGQIVAGLMVFVDFVRRSDQNLPGIITARLDEYTRFSKGIVDVWLDRQFGTWIDRDDNDWQANQTHFSQHNQQEIPIPGSYWKFSSRSDTQTVPSFSHPTPYNHTANQLIAAILIDKYFAGEKRYVEIARYFKDYLLGSEYEVSDDYARWPYGTHHNNLEGEGHGVSDMDHVGFDAEFLLVAFENIRNEIGLSVADLTRGARTIRDCAFTDDQIGTTVINDFMDGLRIDEGNHSFDIFDNGVYGYARVSNQAVTNFSWPRFPQAYTYHHLLRKNLATIASRGWYLIGNDSKNWRAMAEYAWATTENPPGSASCETLGSDPFGYGWNGVNACDSGEITEEYSIPSQRADCPFTNTYAGVAGGSVPGGSNPEVSDCVDTDPVGDGWGWNGEDSCLVSTGKVSAKVAKAVCTDTPPFGDGKGERDGRSCSVGYQLEGGSLISDQDLIDQLTGELRAPQFITDLHFLCESNYLFSTEDEYTNSADTNTNTWNVLQWGLHGRDGFNLSEYGSLDFFGGGVSELSGNMRYGIVKDPNSQSGSSIVANLWTLEGDDLYSFQFSDFNFNLNRKQAAQYDFSVRLTRTGSLVPPMPGSGESEVMMCLRTSSDTFITQYRASAAVGECPPASE